MPTVSLQDVLDSGTTEEQLVAVIPLLRLVTTSDECQRWVNSMRHLLAGTPWGRRLWQHLLPATSWMGFCLSLHSAVGAEHWPELLVKLTKATETQRSLINAAVATHKPVSSLHGRSWRNADERGLVLNDAPDDSGFIVCAILDNDCQWYVAVRKLSEITLLPVGERT